MTFRARKKPIWTFTRRGYLASLSAKAARIWGWLMRKMGDVASFSIMNCTSFGIAPRRPFCSRTSKRHGVRGSAILGEMDDLGDKEPWHRTAPTPAIHCWHPERHRLWTVCFPGSRCVSAVGSVLGRTCLHVNDRSWGDALAHIGSVLSHARRVGI